MDSLRNHNIMRRCEDIHVQLLQLYFLVDVVCIDAVDYVEFLLGLCSMHVIGTSVDAAE